MRQKFGSTSPGAAIRSCPRSELHGRIIAAWRASHERFASWRDRRVPGEDLFEVAETSIPDPADGQLLIRNAYFSVDPYMRPRMNDVRSYVAPFTLGEAMTGGAVGRVAVSRTRGTPRATGCSTSSAGASGHSPTARPFGSSIPSVAPLSTALGVSGCRASPPGTGCSCWESRRKARPCWCPERQVRWAAPPVRWRASRAAASSAAQAPKRSSPGLGGLGFDAVFNYREQGRAAARSPS